MADTLPTEKKIAVVSMLCEGNSIRSIERMTQIHRDTMMRLGVRVGEGCKTIMDEKLRNLQTKLVEEDEILGVVS
jgi:transposase-like protein